MKELRLTQYILKWVIFDILKIKR